MILKNIWQNWRGIKQEKYPGRLLLDTKFDLKNPLVVSFYNLFGKIYYILNEKSIQLILLTSSIEGEGKSLITSNLGIILSVLGQKKVLLVDCDFHHPQLHHIFEVGRAKGLSELLSGDIKIEEAIKLTRIPNLFLLTVGKTQLTTSMLISSELFKNLLKELKGIYDLILFDSSPVNLTQIPTMLAPLIEGVIFIIQAERTQRKMIECALESLKNSKANILGSILNMRDYTIPKYIYSKLYRTAGDYYYQK
ncbi:MAG: CpsD/CapB family tyrosine-protein kinase [bacterium]